MKNSTQVLAIGIDAAEPSLARRLIDRGEMPALKRLEERGAWKRVESPAHVGSGAVWPTFITGKDAREHGVYGEWCWQPRTMGIERYSGHGLTPFWKSLAREEGMTVGIFDVPFFPVLGLPAGFEISEWGAHDILEGRTEIQPARLSEFISQTTSHPFQLEYFDAAGPDDDARLAKMHAACLDGVRLRGELAGRLIVETRPDLAVVVFPEIHHAGHYFWPTVAPRHPLYADDRFRRLRATNELEEIYSEVDRQIGKLIEVAGEEAFVMVFSLHGMRPTLGVPAFLDRLMLETGWARLAGWASQSWRERARSLFAAVKRHTPAALKKLYYKSVSRTTAHQLAQSTMIPAYDWTRTRAFSLPTDQHGWLRINLIGREAKGIVEPQKYEETCRELRQMLEGLRAGDGRRLVRDCLITSSDVEEALAQPLPDLIIHYEEAAHEASLRISGLKLETQSVGKKFTGQHAPDGFLVAAGDPGVVPNEPTISAKDLHRLIVNALVARRVTH
ncbi:MAG TPA: alkaline phosphatase family protein [Pyrinomonadaceae bacterium]